MKKVFISPEIEIINFFSSDIITTSGIFDESEYDDQTSGDPSNGPASQPSGGEIELPIDPF